MSGRGADREMLSDIDRRRVSESVQAQGRNLLISSLVHWKLMKIALKVPYIVTLAGFS